MKRIALIGSTGSIGRQVISVVGAHPDKFRIVALVAYGSRELFFGQVNKLRPEAAALISGGDLPDGISGGEQAAADICALPSADIVFVACSGFAGLKFTLAALKAGKRIALANKETLVCGGELVMPLAGADGLIPVDSEHSAIWQCLNFNRAAPFKRLIITASGGAFRGKKFGTLKNVTAEQALAHPTWKMGKKITVDSATLLNKGYEVIEAHHLFGAPYSAITAVIHPQSIVHSMVEFADGAVMAQMSTPTMELPIQTALTYPERMDCNVRPMDFGSAFSLGFEPLLREDYPCYDLALKCGERGGTAPTLLNAAAEVAVGAFLRGELAFTDIYSVADALLQATPSDKITTYAELAAVDARARREANRLCGKYKR